jgi:hypothetical protein
MVRSLTTHQQTHEFFDSHYQEIEQIRFELQDEGILECYQIEMDLKNFFAWLAFEHIANKIYQELEE